MYGIVRSWQPLDAYRQAVVDRALRPLKSRLLAPLTVALARVPADAVTLAGVVVGLVAALLAAFGRFDLALAAWWLNRLLDGLDGELARATRRAGRAAGEATGAARGAYLDLMADLLVYAAVALGLAAGAVGTLTGAAATGLVSDPLAVWMAAAVTAAAFYLNLGSWALLAPLLPQDEAAPAAWPGSAARGGAAPPAPGLRMPAGLMEGAETIVAFSIALLWPAGAAVTLSAIGLLTLLSAAQRTWWGAHRLRRSERS